MKLLVIGSGGREHALAWKLAQSPRVQKVFVAPGNGGTATEDGVQNVSLTGIEELVAFSRKEKIHLTVVGPEAPLAAGIAAYTKNFEANPSRARIIFWVSGSRRAVSSASWRSASAFGRSFAPARARSMRA